MSSLKLISSLVFLSISLAAQTAPTATSVQGEINAKGAVATVKRLTSAKGQWDAVERQIETGNMGWLRVADKLLEGTDAGNRESLYYALSIALTHNAEGVLSMMSPNVAVDKVCAFHRADVPPQVEREFRSKARGALMGVTSPELKSRKEACLKSLAGTGPK